MSLDAPTPTRAEIRATEITDALAEISGILDRTETTFAVQQTMEVAGDGTARYSYVVKLVSR